MSLAVRSSLAAAITEAFRAVGVAPPETLTLERPKQKEHGDWSSNAALKAAKPAGRNPRELATALAAHLLAHRPAHVTAVEIAGGGFLNFRLADSWLHEVLRTVVTEGPAAYARADLGGGVKVNVEYVSANPTGPLHLGHARWAAYGDSLVRLLNRCGYHAEREFYINDRGVQMESYGASLAARKRGEAPPEDGYHGNYVIEWAAEMPDGADPLEWGRTKALTYQAETMARMHAEFDRWSSERELVATGAVEETLRELEDRGVLYAQDGATWLRTTDFGDDKDRVLIKGDGEFTYFLPDIAYHRDKFTRAARLIDIWGADHHGYVARMKAAMQALGHDPGDLEILIGQHAVLLRSGAEVRLSKRSGDIIELAEVIDEVGADPARLTFLLQSVDTRQSFDIDVVRATSSENPVYYLQYAPARIAGLAREAAARGVQRAPLAEVDLATLVHPRELDALRILGDLPEVVVLACQERAPHKVSAWARELAAAFHGFYHDCPILHPETPEPVRQARLWLAEAIRIGLVIALDLLGVDAPDRM